MAGQGAQSGAGVREKTDVRGRAQVAAVLDQCAITVEKHGWLQIIDVS